MFVSSFAVIVCLGWSITFWVVVSDNACTIWGKLLDLFDERAVRCWLYNRRYVNLCPCHLFHSGSLPSLVHDICPKSYYLCAGVLLMLLCACVFVRMVIFCTLLYE
jgi:hypothetical protein